MSLADASRTFDRKDSTPQLRHETAALPRLGHSFQLRETFVAMAVIAIVIRESRFREKPTRFDEAVDRPLRCLVPTDIESEQLRKELQLAVWQIVMNPPLPLLASSWCPFDLPTKAQRSSSTRPCGRLCFGDPRYGGLDFSRLKRS